MQEIIINVKPGGETKVEVNGVAGADCAKLTEDLLRALGGDQTSQKKPEYYATASAPQQANQAGG